MTHSDELLAEAMRKIAIVIDPLSPTEKRIEHVKRYKFEYQPPLRKGEIVMHESVDGPWVRYQDLLREVEAATTFPGGGEKHGGDCAHCNHVHGKNRPCDADECHCTIGSDIDAGAEQSSFTPSGEVGKMIPSQSFHCPHCGAPGLVNIGQAEYSCQCRFSFVPHPPVVVPEKPKVCICKPPVWGPNSVTAPSADPMCPLHGGFMQNGDPQSDAGVKQP